MNIVDEARRLTANGWKIFPLEPRSKNPLPGSNGWHGAKPDPTPWERNPNLNLGLPMAANGLIAFDIDGQFGKDSLTRLEAELGPLPTTRTHRRGNGHHLIFAVPNADQFKTFTIASNRDGNHEELRLIANGYLVAPPSIHPDGEFYDLADHPVVALPERWRRYLHQLRQQARQEREALRVAIPRDDRPGDDYNDHVTCEEILEQHGWTFWKQDQKGTHWTRPGKTRGTSAVVYRDNGKAHIYSSSAPIDADQQYDSFGLLARLDFNSDFGAATRHIATLGFGNPAQPMPPIEIAAAPPTVTPADTGSDWERLDAAAIATQILDGTLKPETPDIGNIPNAPALMYRGRVNQIFGESGGGKTWIALHLIAETLRNNEHVLLVDYEDSLLGTTSRLLALGITIPQLARLDYRNPDTSIGHAAGHLDHTHDYALIVVDSTGESLAAGGVDDVDSEIARWFALVRQTLNLPGNPAILLIDHIAKSREANPLYAIGSQRKRAAVTGAAYRVDTVVPFAQGRNGIVKLTVAKDRLGTRPRAAVACEAHITSELGQVRIDLQLSEAAQAAAEGKPFRPTVLMERVSIYIEDNPECSWNSIRRHVTGNEEHLGQALKILCDEGYVAVGSGPRKALLNTSIKPFRNTLID